MYENEIISVEDDELTYGGEYVDLELEETEEFDVQFSIIKTKTKTSQPSYFVKFDLFTNSIVEISPIAFTNEKTVRHGIIQTTDVSLIHDIFTSKIALDAVKVKFDEKINDYTLIKSNRVRAFNSENKLIKSDNDKDSVIHVFFDSIKKKIRIKLNHTNYKNYISGPNFNESNIFNKNIVKCFCVDSSDSTSLFGKFEIDLKKLFDDQEIVLECKWLPDGFDSAERIHMIHSNTLFKVSYSTSDLEDTNQEHLHKPQILYKQQNNMLMIQSIMDVVDNYRVRDNITLFFHKQDDPSVLLGKIAVEKDKFNNFGKFNLSMNYSKKVVVSTDHNYLYIEDNDASTYFKF